MIYIIIMWKLKKLGNQKNLPDLYQIWRDLLEFFFRICAAYWQIQWPSLWSIASPLSMCWRTVEQQVCES